MTADLMAKYLVSIIVCLVILCGGSAATRTLSAGNTPTPTAVHALFHEDFSTRANRWRLLDMQKANVDYSADGMSLQAVLPNYALWTYPDTDLKLARFEIQTEAVFAGGGTDARAGMIIDYRADNDLLVLAVSRAGDVYFGDYYFGVWKDILPPIKVQLEAGNPVSLDIIVDANHNLRFLVNGQTTFRTVIKDFKAGSFGLFAMAGKHDGMHVTFRRFSVNDLQ